MTFISLTKFIRQSNGDRLYWNDFSVSSDLSYILFAVDRQKVSLRAAPDHRNILILSDDLSFGDTLPTPTFTSTT